MFRHATTPFLPSKHGFHFTNHFAKQPDWVISIGGKRISIGNASHGLCGGMVYAARDFYSYQLPIPNDSVPPAAPAALFDYISARLYESFSMPLGPLKYLDYMASPDEDQGAWIFTQRGVAHKTIVDEVPLILAELDQRRPVCLGLIQAHSSRLADLGKNHQVLAYGYDINDDGVLTLRVYDPNTAHGVDSVNISLSLKAPSDRTPMSSNVRVGGTLRGFFRHYYERADPRVPRQLPWPTRIATGPAHRQLPGEVSGGGDLIRITIQANAVADGFARLILKAGPKIRQWKGLRLSPAQLSTEGTRRMDEVMIDLERLTETRLVLSKARFLGIHTDVHVLDIGDAHEFNGCSVEFAWNADSGR